MPLANRLPTLLIYARLHFQVVTSLPARSAHRGPDLDERQILHRRRGRSVGERSRHP
ncbi:hypothetical protein PSCLAVI8L_320036 [Pseudoclavibacter sp. 8L]|nr:hypothetical protein PSCLAVI8L_320036 [Pseudoclavibacter sp. 8L]